MKTNLAQNETFLISGANSNGDYVQNLNLLDMLSGADVGKVILTGTAEAIYYDENENFERAQIYMGTFTDSDIISPNPNHDVDDFYSIAVDSLEGNNKYECEIQLTINYFASDADTSTDEPVFTEVRNFTLKESNDDGIVFSCPMTPTISWYAVITEDTDYEETMPSLYSRTLNGTTIFVSCELTANADDENTGIAENWYNETTQEDIHFTVLNNYLSLSDNIVLTLGSRDMVNTTVRYYNLIRKQSSTGIGSHLGITFEYDNNTQIMFSWAYGNGNDVTVTYTIKRKDDVMPYNEVKHIELLTLRDNGKLIPGNFYRITDYETVTIQEGTNSANHKFDIVVLATSNNTLSERAWAVYDEEDTYFEDNNCKLDAWQIWYCLDNDSNRFYWVNKEEQEITTDVVTSFICSDGNEYFPTDNVITVSDPLDINYGTYYEWNDGNDNSVWIKGHKNPQPTDQGLYDCSSTPYQRLFDLSITEIIYETVASNGPLYIEINGKTKAYRDSSNDKTVSSTNYYAWKTVNNNIVYTTVIDERVVGTNTYFYRALGGLGPSGTMVQTEDEVTFVHFDGYEFVCKGVIYRMIDEWGNDLPYDFKNIQFDPSMMYYDENETNVVFSQAGTVSSITTSGAVYDYNGTTTVSGNTIYQWYNASATIHNFYTYSDSPSVGDIAYRDTSMLKGSSITAVTYNNDGLPMYLYTFNYFKSSDNTCLDFSLCGKGGYVIDNNGNVGDIYGVCYNNVFKNTLYDLNYVELPFVVFYTAASEYNESAGVVYNNTFGYTNEYMLFEGKDDEYVIFDNNTFGNESFAIYTKGVIEHNKFDNSIGESLFISDMAYNKFESYGAYYVKNNELKYSNFGSNVMVYIYADAQYINVGSNNNIAIGTTETMSSGDFIQNIVVLPGFNNVTENPVSIDHQTFNDTFSTTYHNANSVTSSTCEDGDIFEE